MDKAKVISVITLLVVLGPQISCRAASTDISDIPMIAKNPVQPNILLTIDDSGSMAWDYVPDELSTTPNLKQSCANTVNGVYYDPDVVYTPGVDKDTNSLGDSSFTNAWKNGYDKVMGGTLNLATAFNTRSSILTCGEGAATSAFYFVYDTTLTGCTSVITDDNCYRKVVVSSTSGTGNNDLNGDGVLSAADQDERTNFANWYSYYRTRILLAKTAAGQNLALLYPNFRFGYHAINTCNGALGVSSFFGCPGSIIGDFADPTKRTTFFNWLYGLNANGSTPLRTAYKTTGNYFTTSDINSPYAATPGVVIAPELSCRENYQVMFTDGYWNQGTGIGGNVDGTNTTFPNGQVYTAANQPLYNDTNVDFLADGGFYYWSHDLRLDLANNVPTSVIDDSGTPTQNFYNPINDPANWQHLNTYLITLGVSGNLKFPDDLPALKSGTKSWGTDHIDDIWHTAINSRGDYFNAKNAGDILDAFGNILGEVIRRTSNSSAVAVSNPYITTSDNTIYVSTYKSGSWKGDLTAIPIDLATGNPGGPSSALWHAADVLDTMTTPATTRIIVSYSGTAGIPFQVSSLSSTQQNAIKGTLKGSAAAAIAYIRGDRSLERKYYRYRYSLLGDVINAEPVVLNPPNRQYSDAGYSNHAITYANRTKIIFQGANDGMLHVFNPSNGVELWSYIPGKLIPQLNFLPQRANFLHKYFVDGTPLVRDVDFNRTDNTSGLPDWRTILVGGFNKGGFGFYALDVTNPNAANETAAAAKVLWEFPPASAVGYDPKDVGYSFGQPIVTKTQATGWVVLVTSGYNNGKNTGDSQGDGEGHLFVLNPKDGHLICDISTGAGTITTPSGLAHISAYIDNAAVDNTVKFVYGGDLLGNVWRFDLTGANCTAWQSAVTKLAQLVDASNNPQPVTTLPELTDYNAKPLVLIGTGQYFGDKDIPGVTGANPSAAQTQSMYGLRDDLTTTGITPLRSNLVQQTFDVNRKASSNTIPTSKRGWYIDFPTAGERVNTHPVLIKNTLTFTTNLPNTTNPCANGGSSWLYFISARTGGYLASSSTLYPNTSAISMGNVLSSRPAPYQLPTDPATGKRKVMGAITDSDGNVQGKEIPIDPGATVGKRIGWRELIEG